MYLFDSNYLPKIETLPKEITSKIERGVVLGNDHLQQKEEAIIKLHPQIEKKKYSLERNGDL